MAKTASNQPANSTKITPDDIENKLRAFQGDVQNRVNDTKGKLVAVGGGLAVVLLILFFLLGRRAGSKKTTLVEIKRF